MVNSVGSNSNSIQHLRALNAFKYNESIKEKAKEQEKIEIENPTKKTSEIENDVVKAIPKHILGEIKSLSEQAGIEVSEKDISYGVMYGRSIMVDYSA